MALVVSGHRKYYNDVKALESLSFTLEPGGSIALLGPNGAGKSTAIKILVSLVRPDEGGYTWQGEDLLAEPRKIRDLVGYVSQELALDKVLTGAEFMRFCAGLLHLNWKKNKDRAHALLETMGLGEAANRPVGDYSGGMKRRLDLAASLLHDPKILILDEPTTGLDIDAKEHIWSLIGEYVRKGGALILASHDFREVTELASYTIILRKGEIAGEGAPEALRAALGNYVVRIKTNEYMDHASRMKVREVMGTLDGDIQWYEEDECATLAYRGGTEMSDLHGMITGNLTTAGLPVYSVNVQKPTLEDVYRFTLGEKS